MSTTAVEQRVVEMRFDNAQFEDGVEQSMTTLEKLKKALDFSKTTKDISAIEAASDSFSMSGMSEALDAVTNKFSVLGTIGDQVLRRLTDSALGLVHNLMQTVNMLTFDNIGLGFSKYDEYTHSIQTILAATGKDIEYIEEQMSKLNWFTDETSYNLTDMTTNIGRFTSNGIELEQAITSMIGIANAAGLAGAGVEAASHAMDGFSKAMGAGYMNLQNWRWIQTARMDTEQFKNILIQAAVEAGKLKDLGNGVYETFGKNAVEVSSSNFTEGLKQKWLDVEVMNKALSVFGDFTEELKRAQDLMSMDTTTDVLQLIDDYREGVLNFDELSKDTGITVDKLKEQFKALTIEGFAMGEKAFRLSQEAKTFQEAIDSVKDAASTGWMNIYKTIFGNYEEAKELWTNVANSLYDVFVGPIGTIQEAFEGWRSFDDGFDGRMELLDAFGTVLEYISSLLAPIKEAFSELFPPLTANRLRELTEKFKAFAESLTVSEGAQSGIYYISKAFFALLKGGLKTLGFVINVGWSIIKIIATVVGKIFEIISAIIDFVKGVADAIKETEAFKNTVAFFGSVIADVRDYILGFRDAIKDAFASSKNMKGVQNLLSVLSEIKSAISSSVVKLVGKISGFFSKIAKTKIKLPKMEGFAGVIDAAADSLANFLRWLKDATKKVGAFIGSIKDLPLVQGAIETLSSAAQKVGEWASPLLSKASEILSSVWDSLKNFEGFKTSKVERIGDSFETLGEKISKLAIVQTISTAFSKVSEKIKGAFSNGFFSALSTGFGNLKKIVGDALQGVSEFLTEFWNSEDKLEFFRSKLEGIKKLFEDLKERFETFAKAKGFADALEKIKEAGKKAADGLAPLIEKIKEFAGSITPGQVAALAFIVMLLGLLDNINKLVGNMSGAAFNLSSMLGTIKTTIQNFSAIKYHKTKIMEVAAAIFIICAALAALTMLDQDKLEDAARVMIRVMIIFAAMAGVLLLIEKLDWGIFSHADMAGVGMAMIGLAAGVLILVGALKALEYVDMNGLQGRIAIIAELALVVGGIAVLISKFAGTLKGAVSILAFAAFVWALGQVIKSLVEISNVDPKTLEYTVKQLFEVMAGLAVLAVGIGQIGVPSVIGLLALVFILKKCMPELKEIASIDYKSIIESLKGSIDVTKLLIALAVVMAASSLSGKGISKFGSGLLKIAIAIAILVGVVKLLSGIPAEDVTKGLRFISECLKLFALLEALSFISNASGGFKKFATGMIIIAIALAALAAVVYLIGSVDQSQIDKGMGVVKSLLAMIALLEFCSMYTEKAKLLPLIATIGIIVVVAGALKALADMPLGGILVAANAMNAVFIVLAITMRIIGGSLAGSQNKTKLAQMGVLLTVAGLVVAVAFALKELASAPVEGIKTAVIGMSGILIIFAAMVKLLTSMNVGLEQALTSFITMTILLAVMAGIWAMLRDLAQYDWKNLLGAAASMSLVLVSLVGAMAIAAIVPPGAAISALVNIGEFLAGLILIVAAINAIVALTDWAFGEGASIKALQKVGDIFYELGAMFGKIISGFAVTIINDIGDALPQFGESLGKFAERAAPFFDMAKGVDEGVVTSTKNMASAISNISSANFVNGITSWLSGGNDLAAFGDQVKQFGEAMVAYSNTVSGNIDVDAVNSSANAANALSTLAKNLPNEGGWLATIIGDNRIADFGDQLVSFGENMAKYSEAVSGTNKIDEEAVTSSANAASALAALAKDLPNTGGRLATIIGDNRMDDFGKQLVLFGNAMRIYSRSITSGDGIDEEAVEASANAATILVELSKSLQRTGGVAQGFSGDKRLDDFGNQITVLAKGLVEFSDIVKNSSIDEDSVEAAAKCADLLVAIQNGIGNKIGGLGSVFAGDESISALGKRLPKFGKGIADFADSIKGISVDHGALNYAVAAGTKLVEMSSSMSKVGGLGAFLSGDQNLEYFGKQLKAFGKGIVDFNDVISGTTINTSEINKAMVAATTIARNASDIRDNIIGITSGTFYNDLVGSFKALGEALTAYTNSVGTINDSAISETADAIKELASLAALAGDLGSLSESLSTLAKTSLEDFLNEFKNSDVEVSNAMKKVTNACITAIDEEKVKFKNKASALITNFKTGLEEKKESARSAAGGIAEACVNKIRNYAYGTNSFSGAGRYCVEGFASGISLSTYIAKQAAARMAQAAIDQANATLDSNSPSKEFIKIGGYVSEGFAIGITKLKDKVVSAADDVTSGVVDVGGIVHDKFMSILQDDFVADPTIRPVIDMSEIQNGMSIIDSMFGTQRSLDLATNGSIAYNASNLNVENLDEKIAHAIDDSINKIYDKINSAMRNEPMTINVPVSIDKRQFARATATVTRDELDRIDYFNNRKAGIA